MTNAYTQNLTALQREVLGRMLAGDRLKRHARGRIFLHSADPARRTTREIRPRTLHSLAGRALVWPAVGGETGDYGLTDAGEAAARLLRAGESFGSRPRRLYFDKGGHRA